MSSETLISEIREILNKTLPEEAYKRVTSFEMLGVDAIQIAFAASNININGVEGQKPQIVSLKLSVSDFELKPQVFGGFGGRYVHRLPNLDDPNEKHLALKGIPVLWRRPRPEIKFILAAIERFALNWLKVLKENQDDLMYQDIVDYKALFS